MRRHSDFLTNTNINRLPDLEIRVPGLAPILKALFSMTGGLHLEFCFAGRILHQFFFAGDGAVPALRQLRLMAGAPANRILEPKTDIEFIRKLFGIVTTSVRAACISGLLILPLTFFKNFFCISLPAPAARAHAFELAGA